MNRPLFINDSDYGPDLSPSQKKTGKAFLMILIVALLAAVGVGAWMAYGKTLEVKHRLWRDLGNQTCDDLSTDCNDNNACTLDILDGCTGGCYHQADQNGGACSNACFTGSAGTCSNGACVGTYFGQCTTATVTTACPTLPALNATIFNAYNHTYWNIATSCADLQCQYVLAFNSTYDELPVSIAAGYKWAGAGNGTGQFPKRRLDKACQDLLNPALPLAACMTGEYAYMPVGTASQALGEYCIYWFVGSTFEPPGW